MDQDDTEQRKEEIGEVKTGSLLEDLAALGERVLIEGAMRSVGAGVLERGFESVMRSLLGLPSNSPTPRRSGLVIDGICA
jgi:hypothetical protein